MTAVHSRPVPAADSRDQAQDLGRQIESMRETTLELDRMMTALAPRAWRTTTGRGGAGWTVTRHIAHLARADRNLSNALEYSRGVGRNAIPDDDCRLQGYTSIRPIDAERPAALLRRWRRGRFRLDLILSHRHVSLHADRNGATAHLGRLVTDHLRMTQIHCAEIRAAIERGPSDAEIILNEGLAISTAASIVRGSARGPSSSPSVDGSPHIVLEPDAQLRQAALFRGVDQDAVDRLCREFEFFDAPTRSVVFRQGDLGQDLYVVISGKVKLARRAPDGRESLVAIVGATDQFGELSLFDPGPRTSTASVVTNARVARVSGEIMRGWVSDHPHVGLQLLRVVARRLRRTHAVVSELIFIDVQGRVANQLLRLAKRFGSVELGGMYVRHDLTQEELAQLVGASRETVNKVLSDFVGRGWIRLQAKSVVICDPERLARMSP
jgi:CRP/FNR family cyclic AMP-dependent transcriptional regulator